MLTSGLLAVVVLCLGSEARPGVSPAVQFNEANGKSYRAPLLDARELRPRGCNRNNCLRQLDGFPGAAAFCATYTTTANTATTDLPAYVSQCDNSPAKISSACSCVAMGTPPTTTPGPGPASPTVTVTAPGTTVATTLTDTVTAPGATVATTSTDTVTAPGTTTTTTTTEAGTTGTSTSTAVVTETTCPAAPPPQNCPDFLAESRQAPASCSCLYRVYCGVAPVTSGRSWRARNLADASYTSCMRSCDDNFFCTAFSLDTSSGVCLQYDQQIQTWQHSSTVMSALSPTIFDGGSCNGACDLGYNT